jgi:hypothetical protein
MDKEFNLLYDYLVDTGIATQAEVDLVCCINGRNLEALEDILFCRTGYRSLDQIQGYEDEEDEDEEELEDNTDYRLEETLAVYDIAGING